MSRKFSNGDAVLPKTKGAKDKFGAADYGVITDYKSWSYYNEDEGYIVDLMSCGLKVGSCKGVKANQLADAPESVKSITSRTKIQGRVTELTDQLNAELAKLQMLDRYPGILFNQVFFDAYGRLSTHITDKEVLFASALAVTGLSRDEIFPEQEPEDVDVPQLDAVYYDPEPSFEEVCEDDLVEH